MRTLSILLLAGFLMYSSNGFSCNCDKAKGKHSCSAGCKGHKDGKSCEGNGACEGKAEAPAPAATKK